MPPRRDDLSMRQNVEIRAKDKYGKLVWVQQHKNIVVSIGREQVAKMIAEGAFNPITEMGWGSGGHDPLDESNYFPALLTDTALNDEKLRKLIAAFSYPEIGVVRFIGIVEPVEIPGVKISEQGLFHRNGELFARLAYPVIYKGPVQLEFRWTIHV